MQKKVKPHALVTGGAGFIGSHVVDLLMRKGWRVTVFDDFSTGNWNNIKQHLRKKNFRVIKGNVKNYVDVYMAMKSGVDYVFHLAAIARIQPSLRHPLSCHDVNETGTLHVLDLARELKVKKVIFSSSSSVYGKNENTLITEDSALNPLSPYAAGKAASEMHCKVFNDTLGLPNVCLRYFNVYGHRMIPQGDYSTVISIFMDRKKKKKTLIVYGNGEQRRDFTWVEDVAQANYLAAMSTQTGIFNIGCGENYSINEVAKMVGGKVRHAPERKGEYMYTLADSMKAKVLLGWVPKVSFTEGMRRLLKP